MSLCCVVLYMNLVRRLLNEATNTTQNTVDRIVDTTTCCYERKIRFYFSITLGLLQNFMVMHKFYFRVLFLAILRTNCYSCLSCYLRYIM